MTVNAAGYAYVEETRPIAFAKVTNPKGYWDLLIHKTKNGKAIRIATRNGDGMVCVGVDKVDDLIKKLQEVKAKGAKTSTNVLPFNA